MSLSKRILALAAAGAAALALGGLFGASRHAAPVAASGPQTAVIGCTNGTGLGTTAASGIIFPTTGFGVVSSGTQLPSGGIDVNGNPLPNAFFNFLVPNAAVTCGAIFEDTGTVVTVPAGSLVSDADPSTVDGGTISYALSASTSPATAVSGGVATILESNANTANINCGSSTPPTVVAGAVTVAGGVESCQGAVLLPTPTCYTGAGTCTAAAPSPGNLVHVGLRPGATFSLVGASAPNLAISATYNRFPSLTAVLCPGGVCITGAGPSTLSTNSIVIGFLAPSYSMTLTPSPATIPAASGTGVGSTLTAALFRTTFPSCIPTGISGFVFCGPGAVPLGAIALQTVAGAEPGVVTFSTSSGVFGSTSATPGASAQQVVSVHCGAVPATAPVILIPALGLISSTSSSAFLSCVSVQAVLYGGGAAGTAVVVANYVGDFTGQTAVASTTVALAPTAATVNLTRGCNEVITPASTAANTPVTTIVGLVQPGGIVVSVWMFNNSLKSFQAGYFSTAGAPVDFTTVGPNQSLFICVSSSGTFPTGAF